MEELDAASARRIAIAATGLAARRPEAEPTDRHVRGVVGRLGLLQIDSVSVLARAHYLPLFSRLGPYRTGLLDEAAWGRRKWLFEYWAHEASFVPLHLQPLFRWRMARAAAGHGTYSGLAAFAAENRAYVQSVLDEVRARGPTMASDLPGRRGHGGWWGWSGAKHALEWLFWAGRVSVASRRGFERVYDLTERVLPRAVQAAPTPPEADAHRELLRIAAKAMGIATAADLRDYHRIAPKDAVPRIAELVESGELLPVRVRSWAQPAYVDKDARWPRKLAARALLAPFDPLVWHRPRVERLFGFHYRIEIYTPAAKREHGYYVLPFLFGDRLVARVDLKSDRRASTLWALSAHCEEHCPAGAPDALAAELAALAQWLGLERVTVRPTSEFAGQVASAVAALQGPA